MGVKPVLLEKQEMESLAKFALPVNGPSQIKKSVPIVALVNIKIYQNNNRANRVHLGGLQVVLEHLFVINVKLANFNRMNVLVFV